MKKSLLKTLLLFNILLIPPATAYAFDLQGIQPLQPYGTFSTFTAYNLDKGKWGLELLTERSIDPNFYRFTLVTAYGVTDTIELIGNLPFVTDYLNDEGLEDISMGFKQKILKEKRLGPSVSYLLTFSVPGKDRFSYRGRAGAGLIVSKRLGPFLGNLNLLYFKPTSSSLEDEYQLRIGLDMAAGHNFNLLTELIVKKSHFSESIDLIEGRLGYRVKLSSGYFGTVGMGYDFKNRNPELRLFLSLSMILPVKEKKIKKIYYEEE